MNKWKFPHGIDLTPTGHNNTAIEMFLDNIVDSLTREVLQNSLDAHNPNVDEPVTVTFDLDKIYTNEIPGIDTINDALKKAKEMWKEKGNEDTLNHLNHFEEVIKQNETSILKISDYNTTGLDNISYESLIVGSGYSQKSSESSAGSKGIGKAAPFAASDLRMVFYNTYSLENQEKSAGIMNFVSYYKDKEKNDVTQERASYVNENENFMNGQFTLNFPHRTSQQYGTDLFIIGLKSFDDWENKIILSTINNFLLSIFNNELEIVVQDIILNSKNLGKILKNLEDSDMNKEERNLFENTLRYYDVITNENSLSFKLDNRFKKYEFIDNLNNGKLTILNHEPANRTILQTRKAGMKIYDRGRISGNINFSGVFQATGESFNAFLKDMENANHDKWSPDRLNGETKRIAKNLLTDLLQWYKQMVKESYEKESENDVGAFGVSDLLPMPGNNQESESKKDSGIRNKINNISISKKGETAQIKDGDKESEQLIDIIDETENGPGESSGSGSDREGEGSGNNPENENVGGDNLGDFGGEGKKTVGETQKLIGPSNVIRLKLIDIDSSQGLYRIVCIPAKNMKKIIIELKYVGADGKSYSIKLLDASSSSVNTKVSNNNIQIISVKKNENFKVDFETKSNLRMKMEAHIYEVKS